MRTARQRHGGSRKFCQFRLSQALANQVVRKGVCGDFILCGLSPPVSASWSLVHRYTFGPPFERLHCGASSAACWEETKGSIPELACPTETQTVQKPELCPRQGQSGSSAIASNSSRTMRLYDLPAT